MEHGQKLRFDFGKGGCWLGIDENNMFTVAENECPGRGVDLVCLEGVRDGDRMCTQSCAIGGYHFASRRFFILWVQSSWSYKLDS